MLWLALRRRDRWELEVEEEIKLHLALRAEQLRANGHSPNDAYAEAVRRFGSLAESRARLMEAARHREHTMQRTEYLADLEQDLSFTLRTLARQKAWTTVTIVTLALGIGATTAVFSVVSTLLLHPINYPHADRVVFVSQQPTSGNNTGANVLVVTNVPVFKAWRQARSFEALEGSLWMDASLKTASGEPSSVTTLAVLPSFLDFAGERVLVGRMFTATDIDNGTRVALVGETFWRERLGARDDVIGRALTIDNQPRVILGVLPRGLTIGGPGEPSPDVWLPLDMRNENIGMSVIGRLRPGVSVAAAANELDQIYARSAGFALGRIPFRAVVTTPVQQVQFRDSLYLLSVAVAMVLIVACVNVAHLLLARATARRRELAIRAALGADRARLVRQLLTESLLLSVAGTVCGVFVGWLGLRGLVALRPESLDSLRAAHLDVTTLSLAVAAAAISGIVFAVVGALATSRHPTHDSLKSGSPGTSATRPHARLRGILVISEMALSAALIVGATLLVRSVAHLQNMGLGFTPNGLYQIQVPLVESGMESFDARAAFMRDVMQRLNALPAVRSATLANVPPGGRWFNIGRLEIEGEAPPPKTATSFIDVNMVQPSYFATMGMVLKYGATFTDTTPASHQVVVNASFARKHWAGSPVGKRLRIARSDTTPWSTIVGVVSDVKTSGPLAESTAPMIVSPMTRMSGRPTILVRTNGDAAALAPAVAMLKQMGVRRVPPVGSVAQTIAHSIAGPRFVMLLLAIFTALALVLAGVGLYGVMAYAVAQQTREIGIRVALGATSSRIGRSVLARGTAFAVMGAVAGLVAAYWGTKLIERQLHGVQRLDPISFAVGGVVLLGAALIACVVPMRRALAVDPMTAIRAD